MDKFTDDLISGNIWKQSAPKINKSKSEIQTLKEEISKLQMISRNTNDHIVQQNNRIRIRKLEEAVNNLQKEVKPAKLKEASTSLNLTEAMNPDQLKEYWKKQAAAAKVAFEKAVQKTLTFAATLDRFDLNHISLAEKQYLKNILYELDNIMTPEYERIEKIERDIDTVLPTRKIKA